MKPETDSKPMLWRVQFQGGAVKVCEATSWTAMLLARTIHVSEDFFFLGGGGGVAWLPAQSVRLCE